MSHSQALSAIHCAALLFGLTGVLGELVQAEPAAITLGRALFAVAALAGFARLRRQPLGQGLTRRRLAELAGTGVLLALHWVTFFVSVKTGGIAVATLGFASFPAFIAVFESALFHEPIRGAEGRLLLLVTAGLVLVTPSFDLADQGTVGLAWGIASGLSFALLAVGNRRAASGIDPIQVACWQNAAVALVMLPMAAPRLAVAAPTDWLWLLLLGVFCTALSHYLFVSSLAVLKARTAGLIIALEPVYAIGFAWLLFGQQPTVRMGIGALLILAASVTAGQRPSRPAKTALTITD